MGAGVKREFTVVSSHQQEALFAAVRLMPVSSVQPMVRAGEDCPVGIVSEQLAPFRPSLMVYHNTTEHAGSDQQKVLEGSGLCSNKINETLAKASRIMCNLEAALDEQAPILRPLKNLTDMNDSDLEKWEREQTAILMEIHDNLKQFVEIKMKIKNLRKHKKAVLKERAKLKRERKTISSSLKQTTTDYLNASKAINTTSSSSSSLSPMSIRSLKRSYPWLTLNASVRPCSESTPKKSSKFLDPQDCIAALPHDEYDLVTIGPNGTKIAKAALQNINWSLKGANVTRKILMEVFDRETLACHTLTGKPSPAFIGCNKPSKGQLDPLKVADIVHIVSKYLNMTEKEVRQAITTKCADENKMLRLHGGQTPAKKEKARRRIYNGASF